MKQKFHIRETLNLLTDADSRSDTIFEKMHDFFLREVAWFFFQKEKKKIILRFFFFERLRDFSPFFFVSFFWAANIFLMLGPFFFRGVGWGGSNIGGGLIFYSIFFLEGGPKNPFCLWFFKLLGIQVDLMHLGACVSVCQLLLALSEDNHPAAQIHYNYLETWEAAGCSEIATAENTFQNRKLMPSCFGCHTGILINQIFQILRMPILK